MKTNLVITPTLFFLTYQPALYLAMHILSRCIISQVGLKNSCKKRPETNLKKISMINRKDLCNQLTSTELDNSKSCTKNRVTEPFSEMWENSDELSKIAVNQYEFLFIFKNHSTGNLIINLSSQF
jgi:hypothetical protein